MKSVKINKILDIFAKLNEIQQGYNLQMTRRDHRDLSKETFEQSIKKLLGNLMRLSSATKRCKKSYRYSMKSILVLHLRKIDGNIDFGFRPDEHKYGIFEEDKIKLSEYEELRLTEWTIWVFKFILGFFHHECSGYLSNCRIDNLENIIQTLKKDGITYQFLKKCSIDDLLKKSDLIKDRDFMKLKRKAACKGLDESHQRVLKFFKEYISSDLARKEDFIKYWRKASCEGLDECYQWVLEFIKQYGHGPNDKILKWQEILSNYINDK